MGSFVRTDLALELKEELVNEDISDGVSIKNKKYHRGNVQETIIDILDDRGVGLLGRPVGRYVTIESKFLVQEDESIHEPIVKLLNRHLTEMVGEAKKITVIGLGNRAVTPDALGPMVVDNLYITRHLLKEGIVSNVRELSALSPGVMAQTGIDTQAIIDALVKEISPDVVIVIDALAAREPSRLGCTLQLCDTGISPGSGVNNNRKMLNRDTLGVKVIAVGVPTVISMPAIVGKCVEGLFKALIDCKKNEVNLTLDDDEKVAITKSVLDEELSTMFVTPKDIDESVKRMSYTISEAINRFFEL